MRAPRLLKAAAVLATLGLLLATPGGLDAASSPGSALNPVAQESAGQQRSAARTRPNVVVVMMDDMRWDELSYAPITRAFLAGSGITFANSFSPLPLCCPARASFLSGRYPHNHHVLSHEKPYGFGALDDRNTVATALQRSGYQTGMVGKYLNGYGVQRSRATGQASRHYVPPGWTDWMVGLDRAPTGGTYNYTSFTQNVNGRMQFNRGSYSSTVIADQSADLVRKYAASSKPFFLWINPVAPHHGAPSEPGDPRNFRKRNGILQRFPTPFVPRRYRGMFDRSITHAPGQPAGRAAEPDVSDKPSYITRRLENTHTERRRLREVQRQRAESIYAWDREFAKVINQLSATRELANTVLVFTSDNGYYLGEHRMAPGKILPHEPSLRVPLLVAGPGVQRGVRYSPAMTIDLAPTLIDIADAGTLPQMDGTSVWPVVTGADRPWTRPVVTESWVPDSARLSNGMTAYGIRTGRYKYIRYGSGQSELYDLFADPNELNSLHRSPAHARVRSALSDQWKRYFGCRAANCRAPLPPSLQTSTRSLAVIESNANRQRLAYYGR